MRATLGPFTLFILLIGTAPAWPQEKKPLNELTSHLNSADRMKRCSAAESLSKLAQTPEVAVPGIVSYVKLEIEQAMLPETGAKRPGESRETLPVVGDEVSLARIKANPDQYTDRPFVITGGIKVSNYYNFWFDNNQPRPEAVVLGRPPEGAIYVRLPPLGAWSWSGPGFLPRTGRGFSVDDDFQAFPLSCGSLPKP